jgi:hypothetical protein
MDKIPFSIYDFFGYLSAGAVTLFGAVFAIQGVDAFDVELSSAQVILLVVAAYVTGHVIAAISSFVLERRLTRKFLGTPTKLLFKKEGPKKGWRRFFGTYHSPLPPRTQEIVLAKAEEAAEIDAPGEGLFFHCFGVVRHDEYPRERLASFLNLYGFARNVAMATLLAALTLAVAALFNDEVVASELWAAAGTAFLVSVVMYFRYLKFYRQYSVELYVTYAEMDL